MAAPNVWTVGTGMTYATISAAIAAAGTVNGDVVEVYAGGVANVYTENVNINKQLQVVCMVPRQGVTIKASGNASCVQINAYGALVRGFGVTNNNACVSKNTINVGGVSLWMVDSCVAFGSGGVSCNGFYGNSTAGLVQNCVAFGFSGSGFLYCYTAYCCTAAKNTLYGFRDTAGGNASALGCLAVGNLLGDYSLSGGGSWCVSGDLTAPAAGGVTGFNTADFVNWAGNDFRISQAARLTTLARLPGYAMCPTDINNRRRPSRERVNFAGCYYGLEQPTWGVGELSGVA